MKRFFIMMLALVVCLGNVGFAFALTGSETASDVFILDFNEPADLLSNVSQDSNYYVYESSLVGVYVPELSEGNGISLRSDTKLKSGVRYHVSVLAKAKDVAATLTAALDYRSLNGKITRAGGGYNVEQEVSGKYGWTVLEPLSVPADMWKKIEWTFIFNNGNITLGGGSILNTSGYSGLGVFFRGSGAVYFDDLRIEPAEMSDAVLDLNFDSAGNLTSNLSTNDAYYEQKDGNLYISELSAGMSDGFKVTEPLKDGMAYKWKFKAKAAAETTATLNGIFLAKGASGKVIKGGTLGEGVSSWCWLSDSLSATVTSNDWQDIEWTFVYNNANMTKGGGVQVHLNSYSNLDFVFRGSGSVYIDDMTIEPLGNQEFLNLGFDSEIELTSNQTEPGYYSYSTEAGADGKTGCVVIETLTDGNPAGFKTTRQMQSGKTYHMKFKAMSVYTDASVQGKFLTTNANSLYNGASKTGWQWLATLPEATVQPGIWQDIDLSFVYNAPNTITAGSGQYVDLLSYSDIKYMILGNGQIYIDDFVVEEERGKAELTGDAEVGAELAVEWTFPDSQDAQYIIEILQSSDGGETFTLFDEAQTAENSYTFTIDKTLKDKNLMAKISCFKTDGSIYSVKTNLTEKVAKPYGISGKIAALTSYNITAEVEITIPENYTETVAPWVILAFYGEEGELLEAHTEKYAASQGLDETYSIQKDLPANAYSAKLFVWDKTNLNPLTPVSVKQIKAEAPSVYLMSDSLCVNYKDESYPQQGWGHYFEQVFNGKEIHIKNRAVGGMSTKFCIENGVWDGVKADLCSGDFVIINFVCNDLYKQNGAATTESEYLTNLGIFYDYITELGATPIFVNQIPTANSFETQDEYTARCNIMRDFCEDRGAYYIDINTPLRKLFYYDETLSEETVDKLNAAYDEYFLSPAALDYFAQLDNGKTISAAMEQLMIDGKDRTHINEKGAKLVSDMILELLGQTDCGLEAYLDR